MVLNSDWSSLQYVSFLDYHLIQDFFSLKCRLSHLLKYLLLFFSGEEVLGHLYNHFNTDHSISKNVSCDLLAFVCKPCIASQHSAHLREDNAFLTLLHLMISYIESFLPTMVDFDSGQFVVFPCTFLTVRKQFFISSYIFSEGDSFFC
jgi:hypothetical protein